MNEPGFNNSDEIVLQHETEQNYMPPVQPIVPVPVIVRDVVPIAEIVPQHISFYTRVLTTTEKFLQLLPLDPLRMEAWAVSLDHDVVLCNDESQCQASANTDTTLARPDGAILSTQAGFPIPVPIKTTAPVWVVGQTFPSRVSVTVYRRST